MGALTAKADMEAAGGAAAVEVSPLRRRLILAALVAVYSSNQWCRSLLFSSVNFESSDAFRFLNVDLDLSRSEYALLGTVAFNALFSACSLAFGAVVDAADAAKVTWASCGVWAVATVAAGHCDTFGALAACRAVQGVAMAATAPAGDARGRVLAVLV